MVAIHVCVIVGWSLVVGARLKECFHVQRKKKKLGRGWWNSVGVIYNDTHAYLLQIDVFFWHLNWTLWAEVK